MLKLSDNNASELMDIYSKFDISSWSGEKALFNQKNKK